MIRLIEQIDDDPVSGRSVGRNILDDCAPQRGPLIWSILDGWIFAASMRASASLSILSPHNCIHTGSNCAVQLFAYMFCNHLDPSMACMTLHLHLCVVEPKAWSLQPSKILHPSQHFAADAFARRRGTPVVIDQDVKAVARQKLRYGRESVNTNHI